MQNCIGKRMGIFGVERVWRIMDQVYGFEVLSERVIRVFYPCGLGQGRPCHMIRQQLANARNTRFRSVGVEEFAR